MYQQLNVHVFVWIAYGISFLTIGCYLIFCGLHHKRLKALKNQASKKQSKLKPSS